MTVTLGDGRPRLGWPTKALYGFGALGGSIKGQLAGLVLLFYNQLVGLPASLVSLALLIGLVVDAFWDPIVGQLSDQTSSRFGRRHPYIYGAILPASLFFIAGFMPPLGWPHAALFVYFLVTVVGARMFGSMVDIPYSALLPELSSDYNQRTSLVSWRFVFLSVVTPIAVAALGYGFFLRGTKAQPYGQLNLAGYAPYAITVSVIGLAVTIASAMATQRFVPYMHRPERTRPSFRQMASEFGQAITNRSFAAIAAAVFIIGFAGGLAGGLMPYFLTYFWELPSKALLQVSLWTIPASLLGLVVAPYFGRLLGKKRACMIVFYLCVLVYTLPMSLRLLGFMPPNSSPWVLRILIVDTMGFSILATMGTIFVTAMIADVVEDVQVKTKRRSEGVLLAADALLTKLTSSVGVLLPGLMLTYVRFPTKAQPGHVDQATLNQLALLYLPTFTLLWLVAGSMLWFYQIDQRKHEENVRRLEEAPSAAEPGADPAPLLVAE